MELRRTSALVASALFLIACGESHGPEQDAAIVFDATFPDTGTDAGPPPSNVGASCATDGDCRGPADLCITELGGYCSLVCGSDADCPSDSVCIDLGTPVCLRACDDDPTDPCPDGLGCRSGQPGIPPICLPGCDTDAECGDGLSCLSGSGPFLAGTCVDPDAELGGPCTSDAECPPSAACLESLDYPGGVCVLAGCNPNTNTGCPGDAQCLPQGFGGGVCWDGCATNDDCRSGWECTELVDGPGRRVCQPVFEPGNLGQVCSAGRGSCQGGLCFTETDTGFPDSYCVDPGCDPDAADPGCPGDGVCARTTAGYGVCLDGCTTNDDCRTAYRCRPVDPERPERGNACFPGCTDDGQCSATTGGGTPYVCNPGTGYCHRPFNPGELGEPCTGTSFRQCRGGLCLTESQGWPGGMCTYPGCSLSGASPSATCPAGSVCADDGSGDPDLGVCVPSCTVGGSDCRSGYECRPVNPEAPDGPAGCVPPMSTGS